MGEMSRSRQAIHAAAKRAAQGPKALGRPRWVCPACGGGKRRNTSQNERLCATCHPPARRGRPQKLSLMNPKKPPANKPAYLTQTSYIRELVPLHVIATLSDVEGDAETKALCQEVATSMLRLRDKLAGRRIRMKLVDSPPAS
jgi:hypothetical protein